MNILCGRAMGKCLAFTRCLIIAVSKYFPESLQTPRLTPDLLQGSAVKSSHCSKKTSVGEVGSNCDCDIDELTIIDVGKAHER
jgi:hypothetical protein